MSHLQIVHGQPRDRTLANRLAHQLQATGLKGTLYLGYPVLASADDSIQADAVLITLSHGSGPHPDQQVHPGIAMPNGGLHR